ncbi:MAG: TIGR02147 family protein [Bdellovibrionaceae bacterium]|nr:TIGR02147 family protein [Pseudobdellovibrionaceae bacterium]
MSIFQFTDYRAFLKSHFRQQPGGGRGQMLKLAKVLDVHSTFVSLVFQDKRDFSSEQAILVAQYFNLTASETDYFLNLVQWAKASNRALKNFFHQKIIQAQEASKRLDTRFEHERTLASEERQIFYSSWHYSAIRIYTSTSEDGRSVEEIVEHFKMPRKIVVEALAFLNKCQLIVEKKNRYHVGPQRTFLEKGHPLLKCHHTNWRQKALNQYEEISNDEMMFTSTLSLSRKDFERLREHLATLIKTTSDLMKETQPEDVACLNIDFFWVK